MELTKELELPKSAEQEIFNVPTLTQKEYEILHMAILGFSNEDIQKNIERTSYSVKWRLANVYNKFNAKDRFELIKIAALKGLHFFMGDQKLTYTIKVDVNEQQSATVNRRL
jgi:DNA-binding CsgD family transcriptional regulator